ncbi:hypothetical protein CAPTEDRAFT_202274 [Capitella teleta]|uniref:Uncharacterized protein n=1 Tax=Capitella teleta TaxID=283909 RepID=R7TA88_CAPTE|nr:hypothetical protein CAPTEDRAFT_202274 [Capitella teleta]|eukprot:ELT90397.1 hypothetical protein CAPTEDRAFT_202274 [Capitella teleta]
MAIMSLGIALSNYRKHFDIIGHRVIDEHHEYHDYGPHDYNDYHGSHDPHGDYHIGDYFDHDYDHYGGGYEHEQQGGYGHEMMSYKPKPQILIIKKIVPLSTTTAP